MRFFITGEVDASIGEKIRLANNLVESKINALFNNNNYGSGVSYWGNITICCAPEAYEAGFFNEIKKYTKKKSEVELRLKIDYESMLKAEGTEAFKLICESILRGVDIAENDLKIKYFDFNSFRSDLVSIFKKEGWI